MTKEVTTMVNYRDFVRQATMTYLCEVARVQFAPITEVADYINNTYRVGNVYRTIYHIARKDKQLELIQVRAGASVRIKGR